MHASKREREGGGDELVIEEMDNDTAGSGQAMHVRQSTGSWWVSDHQLHMAAADVGLKTGGKKVNKRIQW